MLACLSVNWVVKIVSLFFNYADFWLQNNLAQFTILCFCHTGARPFSPCHPYVRDIGVGGGGRTVVRFSFKGICVTILNPPLIGDT